MLEGFEVRLEVSGVGLQAYRLRVPTMHLF